MKYISAYKAAIILGVSSQCIYSRIKRGRFIKGKMVYDKRLRRKEMRYLEDDVIAFKNR